MGKLPLYISNLLSCHNSVYRTRSSEKILLTTPSAFSSYAPSVWNELQATLNLESLPPLNTFKNLLKSTLTECNCFLTWCLFQLSVCSSLFCLSLILSELSSIRVCVVCHLWCSVWPCLVFCVFWNFWPPVLARTPWEKSYCNSMGSFPG